MSRDLVDVAPPEVSVRSVLHALGVIVAAFAVAITLINVVGLVLELAGYDVEGNPLTVNVVGSVFQYVGFIAVAVLYLALANERDLIPIDLPGVRAIAWMIGGFVGVFVASYAVSIIIVLLGLETAQNTVITMGQENPTFFLLMIPVTILFVGPGEELVFRGIVQGQLKRAFGVVPAIVVASFLFGAVHFVALSGSGQLVYIAVAGTLGLVLGTVYELSDNILVPIVIHGFWNAMLFAVNWYVAVSDIQLPA